MKKLLLVVLLVSGTAAQAGSPTFNCVGKNDSFFIKKISDREVLYTKSVNNTDWDMEGTLTKIESVLALGGHTVYQGGVGAVLLPGHRPGVILPKMIILTKLGVSRNILNGLEGDVIRYTGSHPTTADVYNCYLPKTAL